MVNFSEVENKEILWKLVFSSDDTNSLFLDFNLPILYLNYNKKECNIDQDIYRYISITKIVKTNKKSLNTYSCHSQKNNICILNGIII